MASMTTLRSHRPSYTPTKGHVWPIAFDPTSAFVSGASKKSHTHSTNVTAPGTPMPMDSDGGPGGGAEGKTEDALNAGAAGSISSAKRHVEITMPLLHAIRTTAAHTNAVSPIQGAPNSTAGPTNTTTPPKRVVRSAMALEQTHRAAALAQKEREAEQAFTFAGPGGVGVGTTMAAELMLRRLSSPATGTGSSRGPTPKPEGKKKKKKGTTRYCLVFGVRSCWFAHGRVLSTAGSAAPQGRNSPAVQSPAINIS